MPLLATAFLFSCITADKSVGSAGATDDYYLSVGTATFHLPLKTKIADSIQALSSSYGYVGSVRTEEFGLADFSFGTNFCPYIMGLDFGEDQIIKDFYLEFISNENFIFDETQEGLPQNIHVYRMTRDIEGIKEHYYNYLQDSDYDPTPIDSGGVIYNGGDSLIIRLKHGLAKEIMSATQEERDSSTTFIRAMKGLLLTCEPPAEGTYGGRLNSFTLGSSYLYLIINFQPTYESGLSRKDTTILFELGVDYAQNFSTYESKAIESDTPTEYIDVEGMGGIKPFIDPVVLKDTLDAWVAKQGLDKNRIIINKATYYLPFEIPEKLYKLNDYYPQELYPNFRYANDTVTFYTPLDDVYSTSNNFGTIDRSRYFYYGDFSHTIQRLIAAERDEVESNDEYKMWLMPTIQSTTSSYYYSSSSTSYTTDFSSYYVGRINGMTHTNYPYFTIMYTYLRDE